MVIVGAGFSREFLMFAVKARSYVNGNDESKLKKEKSNSDTILLYTDIKSLKNHYH